MYKVDYDAINHWVDQYADRSEKEMIDYVIQAMKDGEITKCSINYEWVICDSCRGNGSHSNHLGVISHEVLSEWDDDDFHHYSSGLYDQACDRCEGTGKYKEIDLESLPDDVQEYIKQYFEAVNDDIAIRRSEMMMGA